MPSKKPKLKSGDYFEIYEEKSGDGVWRSIYVTKFLFFTRFIVSPGAHGFGSFEKAMAFLKRQDESAKKKREEEVKAWYAQKVK